MLRNRVFATFFNSTIILVAALERTDDRIAVNLSRGDSLLLDIRKEKMQNECKVDDVIYKDVVIIGKYLVFVNIYRTVICLSVFTILAVIFYRDDCTSNLSILHIETLGAITLDALIFSALISKTCVTYLRFL